MTQHDNNALIARMISYETDGCNPPDGRRVIRDARMNLQAKPTPTNRDHAEWLLNHWQRN